LKVEIFVALNDLIELRLIYLNRWRTV